MPAAEPAATICANCSTIGSIIGEWNAWEVASRLRGDAAALAARWLRPRLLRRVPETTVNMGALKLGDRDARPDGELEVGGGRADREHRTRGQLLHQPRPPRDECQRIVAGEDTGEARRHVVAEAVAHHAVGRDAPVLPQLRERVARRESAG